MEIGITIPLQKFLRWKQPPYGEDPRLLFCWDIHRADVSGRKLLVVVNAANRFAGIRRMSGADWKKLDAIVPQVIDQAMETAGVPESLRRAYLDAAGAPVFTKTHGRKPVAGLNRVVDDIWFCVERDLDRDAMFQAKLSTIANTRFCHCATRADYVRPVDAFAEDLRQLLNLANLDEGIC